MKSYGEYLVIVIVAFIFTLWHAILTSLVIANFDEVQYSFAYVFGVEWLAFFPLGIAMLIIIQISRKNSEMFSSLTYSTFFKHLGFALLVFTIHAIWQQYINSKFLGAMFNYKVIEKDFVGFLEMRYLIYIIMVGLIGGAIKLKEKGEVSLIESGLMLELQRAKLRELELKINPEIIYPNLNYIRKKAENHPEEASQMVILMAGLLRKLVNNLERDHINITDDVQFFSMYMDILRLRKEQQIDFKKELKGVTGEERIATIILLIPFFEELFFGKYQTCFSNLDSVEYKVIKKPNGRLKLCISMEKISNKEKLQGYIDSDLLLKRTNKLLAGFLKDGFLFSVKVKKLSLMLELSIGNTKEVKDIIETF